VGIILTFFYNHRLTNSIQNPWVYWTTLIIFEDFMYYWLHRVDHHVRFFWATHVTHHSSDKFNFTVGIRSSVMEPLYRFVYFIPLAFFGFTPIDIAFIYSATQTWGILVHTERIDKMGWLEYFLVTPSHHRVHHASDFKYLDKNHGGVLMIWDRLLGTFHEEGEKPTYGLTEKLAVENLATIMWSDWKVLFRHVSSAHSVSEAVNYMIQPPGWSTDGSTKTVKQLRKELQRSH